MRAMKLRARVLRLLPLGGALLSILALAGCPMTEEAAPPAEAEAHDSTQALTNGSLTGASLPAKTLALTFDDGSGARTVELSKYLKAQNIRATFFVNGKCFTPSDPNYPCAGGPVTTAVLTQLVNDGHLVANHTQTHDDLTDTNVFPLTSAGDAQLVKELTDTDPIIKSVVP